MRAAVAFVFAALAAAAAASPSAFPETALVLHGGYGGSLSVAAGAELVLSVPFVDASAGAEVALDLTGAVGVRLSATGLVFPTLGTTPPLALGLGADLSYRDDAVRAHLGVVTGLDLLYVSELPAVISLYLAPGYSFGDGISLAWSAEARYYTEGVAVMLASSDLILVSLGLRVPLP